MSYNGKNYSDGDVLHIGGNLEFDEDAGVLANIPSSGTASAKIDALLLELKNKNFMTPDDWAVTIPTGITYENMATEATAANSNAVDVSLDDGTITVAVGGAIEDTLTLADHGTTWGKHYWLGFGIRTGFASDAGVVFTQLTGMEPGKEATAVTLTAADDDEAKGVGLANAGDIILYIKAETVRDNGGLTFTLGYAGCKTGTYIVVIDESEAE
jgi:hypothetical protein